MINVKVAEEARCKIEQTVGKGIWSPDLIEKTIWRIVAERKLLLGEEDIQEIAKIVLRSRCGEVFTELPEECDEPEPTLFDELWEYIDDDFYTIDSLDESYDIEGIIDNLEEFYNARNQLPYAVNNALYNTYWKLKEVLEERIKLEKRIENLSSVMNTFIDEVNSAA